MGEALVGFLIIAVIFGFILVIIYGSALILTEHFWIGVFLLFFLSPIFFIWAFLEDLLEKMIEIFVLIGWIDGHNAGGVVNQEFLSIETCEAAKLKHVEMHDISESRWGSDESWVECVRK